MDNILLMLCAGSIAQTLPFGRYRDFESGNGIMKLLTSLLYVLFGILHTLFDICKCCFRTRLESPQFSIQ